MKPNKHEKKIDTNRVVEYLERAFATALFKAGDRLGTRDNTKGSVLYQYQVDFCYLVDEIQRGPVYNASKAIQEANQLIEQLDGE